MYRIVFALLLACLIAIPAAAGGLRDYVGAPDDSYAFEITESRDLDGTTAHMVRLTSQTWQGLTWQHWLTILIPDNVGDHKKALLFIDGEDNTDTPPALTDSESRAMLMIAEKTGSVLGILQQVPNQPLFDGMTEDHIIAYTQEQWLTTGDDSWPLLFPMVKSAVRAMDTMNSVAKAEAGRTLQQFVLTGGSKRGWTSWLSAVADPRVCAIAPVVIDTLNMKPQMEHQLAVYGGYSEEVSEYTERGLQSKMDTPLGRELTSMVDPYAYRGVLTLPKLIVLGANDPYWTVDAANFYFDDLVGEKHLYYQANVGHDVNLQGVATIAEFYHQQLNGGDFPKLHWTQDSVNSLDVRWDVEGGTALLWTAQSDNRDFRRSEWSSTELDGEGGVTFNVHDPDTGWTAYFVELRLPGALGMPFGTTTKMTVVPDTLPESGRTHEAKAE